MLSAPRENFAPRRELMDTQLSFHVSSSQRQLKRAQTGCASQLLAALPTWSPAWATKLCLRYKGKKNNICLPRLLSFRVQNCGEEEAEAGKGGNRIGIKNMRWSGGGEPPQGRRLCGNRTFYIRNGLSPWQSASRRAPWYMKGQIHWLRYICAFREISVNSGPGSWELGMTMPASEPRWHQWGQTF